MKEQAPIPLSEPSTTGTPVAFLSEMPTGLERRSRGSRASRANVPAPAESLLPGPDENQPTPLNQEDQVFRPAHGSGHFPTAEEIARLEKLERRRLQDREARKLWRARHPEAANSWAQNHKAEQVVYQAAYYREHKEQSEFRNRRNLTKRNQYKRKKASDPEFSKRQWQATKERQRMKSAPPGSPETTP